MDAPSFNSLSPMQNPIAILVRGKTVGHAPATYRRILAGGPDLQGELVSILEHPTRFGAPMFSYDRGDGIAFSPDYPLSQIPGFEPVETDADRAAHLGRELGKAEGLLRRVRGFSGGLTNSQFSDQLHRDIGEFLNLV